MTDNKNFCTSYNIESSLKDKNEWGLVKSYASIWIDECNGQSLSLGENQCFDLGLLRARDSLEVHKKLFGDKQDFRIVLSKDSFEEVGREFVFKGKTIKSVNE